MKHQAARAPLKAFVMVLSPSGRDVVLVRPRKRKRGWELPGGRIDAGESLPAGATREVLEETGLLVHLDAMVALYQGTRQDGLMVLFLAHALSGDLRPDGVEIAEVRWEPLASAFDRVVCPLNRQRFQDGLQFCGAPVYRLVQKQPFQILESRPLGASLSLGHPPVTAAPLSPPVDPARLPSRAARRWWPWAALANGIQLPS